MREETPTSNAEAAASETDRESPSPEFASALEDFERGDGASAAAKATVDLPVGTRIRGTVIRVGDESTLVDFGGRSEGVVETRHFRAADGNLKVGIGEVLDLYVVSSGDTVVLAP